MITAIYVNSAFVRTATTQPPNEYERVGCQYSLAFAHNFPWIGQ